MHFQWNYKVKFSEEREEFRMIEIGKQYVFNTHGHDSEYKNMIIK